jgi:hypothetical protein
LLGIQAGEPILNFVMYFAGTFIGKTALQFEDLLNKRPVNAIVQHTADGNHLLWQATMLFFCGLSCDKIHRGTPLSTYWPLWSKQEFNGFPRFGLIVFGNPNVTPSSINNLVLALIRQSGFLNAAQARRFFAAHLSMAFTLLVTPFS